MILKLNLKQLKQQKLQYGPRPQFNKTPKYVKYRDAGTGIREYNDGTFDMKRDQDSTSQVKQMHTT